MLIFITFAIKGENMVDEKKCICCGACTAICPVNAIKIQNGKAKIDPKKCIKCGVEKKRSEFYKKTKNKDGYKSECKKCEDDRRKEWRIKKSREMGKVWY